MSQPFTCALISRLLSQAVIALVLASASLPARADPVLMFLVGFARNLAESSMARSAGTREPVAPRPATYPGTSVQPTHVQRLIDDCFTHLSERQRAEIFETLNAELLKPANGLVRGEMIQYFAQTALQVRALQLRLNQLSAPGKDAMAADLGRTLAGLPAEDRRQVETIIRKRLLPVPSDIGERFAARIGQEPAEELDETGVPAALARVTLSPADKSAAQSSP